MKSIVMAVFRPEEQLRYFCACVLKKSPKHYENVFRHASYSCYRNSRSPMRMTTSDFWPGALGTIYKESNVCQKFLIR